MAHARRMLRSAIDHRITFCFVLADEDPHGATPFQGFSPGWMDLRWAMLRLVDLPADVLEPAMPRQAVLARRMGGRGGWRWFPLALRALNDVTIEERAPFWVVFSGTRALAKSVSAWAERQAVRPLHVTARPWGGGHHRRRAGFREHPRAHREDSSGSAPAEWYTGWQVSRRGSF